MSSSEPALSVREANLPVLDRLYFYLTQGCNLACRHCWIAPRFDPAGSRYPVLPVELFETALREARPLGLKGVKLTGGEPLMHPGILRLLERLRREGLGLTMETNGLLCSPRIAAEIAKFPDRCVSVSLDGADARTHDWVRNVPGAFAQSIERIGNLVATGTRPQLILSVLRANAHQLEALVRLAEDLGVASVKFNLILPTARGEALHEADQALSVAELIRLGRYVDGELAQKTTLRLLFDYPMAFRPLHRIAGGEGAGRCGILNILGVLADGSYALCGAGVHRGGLVFGRVGSDPLDSVWRNSPLLNRLRSGLPERLTGICGNCLMRHQCLGSCIAQNHHRSGNPWAPFWFCAEAAEAGLFPNSRIQSAGPPALRGT